MHKVIEKEQLVDIAANLFRMKGYAGTSIDDIARACGVTKGSLYHHFSGKEDLAIAALEQVHRYYREHIFSIVQQHKDPTAKELRLFNTAIENFFTEHPHGCLLANLSLEVENASDNAFSARISLFFKEWIDCYFKVFFHYFPPTKAKTMAVDALAIVQGCILVNRMRNDLSSLRRQHAALIKLCDTA